MKKTDSIATIGSRIRIARERLDLTQTDLSRRLGVTSQIVNMWEAGTKTPGRNNIFKLIEALKVPPMWLFYGGMLPSPDERGYIITAYSPRMVPMRLLHSITKDTSGANSASYERTPVPARFPCGDNAFAIELPDDSNAPRLPKGAICIFDPDKMCQPKFMVLAVYGTPARTIIGSLRFETTADGLVTIVTPLNPDWPAARSDLCDVNIFAVMTESNRSES